MILRALGHRWQRIVEAVWRHGTLAAPSQRQDAPSCGGELLEAVINDPV
jgi:hypothetical protein